MQVSKQTIKTSDRKLNPERPKSEPFEFQNWEVYKKSILLVSEFEKLNSTVKKYSNSLADQLERAAQSIPLNIAEGSSRYSVRDKTNFLRIAKGSVFECVAILDVLSVGRVFSAEQIKEYVVLMADIGKMLSGLMNWLIKNERKVEG